jgi:phosphoglycolate phosphatase-like HAD superfamily hydrolase
MIFRAMAATGVKAVDRVAKVGDTSYDLQEGSSAGCGLVIGITSGAFTREQLLAEPHTHLIDSIPEILAILGL